uniref:Clustered mitochondria protein homolog n=1 Tax=Saccoglossus kowalevskii TaxID=10224 RepID=A0ABM0M934_SACKO|nr:PREDICTED: LOW QUALITY PROTEIN: clustered mitochondria protein homolog [Saccoglossus kowalevskii]
MTVMAGDFETENSRSEESSQTEIKSDEPGTPPEGINRIGSTNSDGGSDTPSSSSDQADKIENEEKTEDKSEDKKDLDSPFLINEKFYVVKVIAPGCDPFELQVGAQEMVHELHQLLMDKEETCHRTCFTLQMDGNVLDNFTELRSIEGLTDGSVIKVVEEPYSVREARIHVRHVRDLLKSIDPTDAYNGTDLQALSFLNAVIVRDSPGRNKKSDSVDCTPPDFIMPESAERPLMPLNPLIKEAKAPLCLQVFTASGWNPPPGNRKLHGDLMYLHTITLENNSYHITASTKGFYINRSTLEVFDPKPSEPKHLSHSLVELLQKISPLFKKNFTQMIKKRSQRHPLERVLVPFQIYSWTAPVTEHTIDSIRAEDSHNSRLGYEEHIPGQTRDWNEEIQTTHDLPRKTLPDRIIRERAIFKVQSDFVQAALRGATAVIDGNIMAINPGEESKMQMYIWNNIFFSLGFDVRDHYKDYGGDYSCDLQGVKAYNNIDVEGLYTLGTVVIDYRGYRVTAQSIIPGILEREQEESVIYGSIDFGKTVATNEKFVELLSKSAQQLKILPHKVLNEKNELVELYSSIECKGIKGNDGRYYILDLLRTFPPDIHYLPMEGEEVSEEASSMGYPKKHRHKLCTLRQELIEAFVEHKYMVFVRHAAFLLMQKQQKSKASKEETTKPKQEQLQIQDIPIDEDDENIAMEIESDKVIKTDATDSESVVMETDSNANKTKTSDSKEKNNDNEKSPCEIEPKSTDEEKLASCDETIVKKVEKKMVNGDEVLVNGVEKESNGEETLVNGVKTDSSDPKEILGDVALVNGVAKESEGINQEVEIAAKELAESIDTYDQNQKEIVLTASRAAGSLSDTEFDVRFNPDVFSPGVKHTDPEGEYLVRQKQVVRDAAHFLITYQIPTMIKDCLEHNIAPIDGTSLSEIMHQRGINIRYISKVADLSAKLPTLSYLHKLCVCEIISRSAKHIFTSYLQGVSQVSLSAAISHFLNCYLSSFPSPQPQKPEDRHFYNHSKKKKNKKKSRYISALFQDSMAWTTLTPAEMWTNIKAEAKEYYMYEMQCESVDAVVEKYHIQKISLLREICLKVGIQIMLREYNFDNKHKPTFTEEDILNMFPVVKHVNPIASDAYSYFQTGQAKVQQGYIKEGYELINEALNLFSNVYGPMHPEFAACLRSLARLHYIMGELNEAMEMQQKAVIMSERCLGVDHPNTITEYMHLALYCAAGQQIVTSLKLMYRARYLALLLHGESHPEVALIDSNIGLVLQGVEEYDLSLKFLQKALENNIKFHGHMSMKTALSYHLVARVQSCKGDFRAALQSEKETYNIYKQHLGEEHEKTKQSLECLRHLTQQAVNLQKAMNELYKTGAKAAVQQFNISPPPMNTVIEMMNIINGILIISLSQKDIEKIAEEMERDMSAEPGTIKIAEAESSSQVEEVTKSSENSKAQVGGIPVDTPIEVVAN